MAIKRMNGTRRQIKQGALGVEVPAALISRSLDDVTKATWIDDACFRLSGNCMNSAVVFAFREIGNMNYQLS